MATNDDILMTAGCFEVECYPMVSMSIVFANNVLKSTYLFCICWESWVGTVKNVKMPVAGVAWLWNCHFKLIAVKMKMHLRKYSDSILS